VTTPEALEGYLDRLTRRLGAAYAVVASADGLLVAGAGLERDALEEVAAHAPSQLPSGVTRPPRLAARRVEVAGARVYLAADVAPTDEAARDVARLLDP
jgi:hypothetical protein